MNNKFLFLFLLFFVSGMTMSCVSAGHTYTKGGYTFTISNSKYSEIQDAKQGYYADISFKVKTNKFKTVKVPKYKNKKVTKTKWKYKNIVTDTDYYDYYGNLLKTHHSNKVANYLDNGWKYDSAFTKKYPYGKDGSKVKYISKVKKKVKYTGTKKVKVGTKKVKLRVYAIGVMSKYVPRVTFRAMGHGYNYPTNFMRYSL